MCFLSPALRRIVTALSAGSALIAAAGEPVILRDFSDFHNFSPCVFVGLRPKSCFS